VPGATAGGVAPCICKGRSTESSALFYRPTILDGEPVEVETSITVIFLLRR
jgi:hypothetical protein